MLRVKVIGIGCGGLDQVTGDAVTAMRSLDVLLLVDKRHGEDPLVARRMQIFDHHVTSRPRVVTIDDPRRDRGAATRSTTGYESAVADWHNARTDVYAETLRPLGDCTAGLLVWGDPAFYDSTLRILEQVRDRGVAMEVDVVPGISAVQMLAARHRLVLNEIGSTVTVTTGRRLAAEIERGGDNIVVMLNRHLDAANVPGTWHIWWGGNLGDEHESLVEGDLGAVADTIGAERARLREECGWVMDVYLLRRAG